MRRPTNVEEIITGQEELDRAQLARVEVALRRRQQGLRADTPADDESRPVSGVVEYRPHADGTSQAEVRRYYRKDGTAKETGPYWYFRHHEGGKQKKLYLGKTDDPEGELAWRLSDTVEAFHATRDLGCKHEANRGDPLLSFRDVPTTLLSKIGIF